MFLDRYEFLKGMSVAMRTSVCVLICICGVCVCMKLFQSHSVNNLISLARRVLKL